ncbi:MAG TPA: ABC transporter ATP-binding protein, partial [Mycobacteriales bacterium]|nr:ABC transporter ATP-binding protein [Mycobacteriales bacterium]
MIVSLRRYAALLQLFWQSSPKWTLLAGGGAIGGGLLPGVAMVASGVLVGAVGGVAADGLSSPAGHRAIVALIVFGAASVLAALLEPATAVAADLLAARYVATVDDLLVSASVGPARIEHLEDPGTARHIAASVEAGREGLNLDAAANGVNVLQQRLSGLVATAILFAYHWWAPLVVTAGWLIYGRTLSRWVGTLFDELIQVTGSDRRRAEYLRGTMHEKQTAKEIRIFGLASWILDRYTEVWLSAMRLIWRNRARSSRSMLAGIAAMALANAVVVSLLAHDAFTGRISAGHLVIFAQAMFGSVSLGLIGDPQWYIARAAGTAEHIRALARRFSAPAIEPSAAPPGRPGAIELRDVTFTYPSREEPTLDGFNLTVPSGQSLAVVGVNGAGKSTLIKLLTGLYTPDHGDITVAGIDAVTGDPAALRRQIAVVFQDFLRYELPLRDNVGFGFPGASDDVLLSAVRDAGGTAVLDRLEHGWDTVLSGAYDGGTDLSGGQWQRVALARALAAVRAGAGVLILDEPTA